MANRVAAKKKSATQKPTTVLYLYGISKSGGKGAVAARGVDGVSAVEPFDCAGLTCWVSRVSRAEFADNIAENMEKLDWLADASVRHQRVVSELGARATTVPTRFGAVFLSEKTLAADITSRKKALNAIFERIADADEWGVKVFHEPRPVQPLPPGQATGREYLQRKAQSLQAPARKGPAGEIVELTQRLAMIANASAPAGKVSSGQRDLEWQASFLVARAHRRQWEATLAEFAARWTGTRRIECTGPWPPYSFVAEEGA